MGCTGSSNYTYRCSTWAESFFALRICPVRRGFVGQEAEILSPELPNVVVKGFQVKYLIVKVPRWVWETKTQGKPRGTMHSVAARLRRPLVFGPLPPGLHARAASRANRKRSCPSGRPLPFTRCAGAAARRRLPGVERSRIWARRRVSSPGFLRRSRFRTCSAWLFQMRS
jgi:hypothetical protein